MDALAHATHSCRVHPCNLHEFSVYGGMSPNVHYMEPLFHGGLKNDSTPETFNLPIELASSTGRRPAVRPSCFTWRGEGSPYIRRCAALTTEEPGLPRSSAEGKRADESVYLQLLPSKYIRIDALTPHTQNYNVSIWFVWLAGITTDVENALASYEEVSPPFV